MLKFRTSPSPGEGTIAIGGVFAADDGSGDVRRITIDAGADLTAALAPTLGGAEHVYDLELASGSSVVDVLVSGYVKVLAEVTR